ncbi:MAG: DPP IV N-terminal domain-containing protein [Planctomycetota bacterium]
MLRVLRSQPFRAVALVVAAALSCAPACAQTYTPMKDLPGSALVRRMQAAMGGIGAGGTVGEVRWDAAAGRVWFETDGWNTIDLPNGTRARAEGAPPDAAVASRAERGGNGRRPARGRQFTSVDSPDGRWVARSEGGNLVLEAKAPAAEGAAPERVQVTSDGGADLKYGQASWVYGEELDQTTAMWWSPDSRFLAFYRFDESPVKDFHILGGWTETNTRVISEAYPKPGDPNPIAGLMVYELATRTKTTIDTASGAPAGTEHYVYNALWTPDGAELLYSRTPRRQDVLEVFAADPKSGRSRLVVREEQETWQDNRPEMRFLADGRRFLWETERTGFKHLELRALDGSRLATVSSGAWPVESIVLVDEGAGDVWFAAWSAPHAPRQQLHVARLDGSGSARVTSTDFHHTDFRISPDRAFVVATAESIATPRHDVLYAAPVAGGTGAPLEGRRIANLGEPDARGFATQGMTPSELFTCKAADGVTDLYGRIHFPPAFDPARKYPVVVETYGGPSVRLVVDRFTAGEPRTALGFLVVSVDNRGTPGRGKDFQSAAYLRLGVVDADDQAAAVLHLAATRPYVDGTRVGITGHSYGGYMSAICLIRRGDVFHAGVAGAPPTDWRQYDTIYTERYMRTPQENPEGYDEGSCVKHAGRLEGKLLLLHGMMDDNVHPNNTFELAHALQSLNKPFAMMLFPNSDHSVRSPASESIKWSFLVEALRPEPPMWKAAEEAAAPAKAGGDES